ncbi:MAG: NUDIX hydrolase, partial [Bdellovibrionales bacterium]|nr:NUDIX hydrolase [Bdellovibrionales bacterium]
VHQYRQAARDWFWEIPGGAMDGKAEDVETPLEAAKRELLEETGYTSKNWKLLIETSPNPALQTNRIHTFLATDCELSAEQNLDPFEDLEVHLKPRAEVDQMLMDGEFGHALILGSLLFYLRSE